MASATKSFKGENGMIAMPFMIFKTSRMVCADVGFWFKAKRWFASSSSDKVWKFHSILVCFKMPFEIRLPWQEKLFQADSNPSTQLSSGAINCMLNMNWHCCLKRLDFSISRIYSYDLLRDEGDYQLEAWKPKQGSAASNSEQCMGEHGYKGSWQPCTTYFLPFPSCN